MAPGYKHRKANPDKWEVGRTWRQSIKEAKQKKIQLRTENMAIFDGTTSTKDSLPRNGSRGGVRNREKQN